MNKIELPEDWNEYSYQQKDLWFARNAIEYLREGEIGGIIEDTSDEVKQAYVEFMKEKENESNN